MKKSKSVTPVSEEEKKEVTETSDTTNAISPETIQTKAEGIPFEAEHIDKYYPTTVHPEPETVQPEPAFEPDSAEQVAFPNFEFKGAYEQRRLNVSELRDYADQLKELCLRGY